MNDFRDTGVPAEGGGSDIGRTALWVVRELGLPAIVKACVSCRSARHHPTGKFRVNANGKLLDVWILIGCELCGRTSTIPVHQRIHVQAPGRGRLLMFQDNDPAMVRDPAMGRRTREAPGNGGSLGKTHCYQGLRVKVTGDQIVDRATGSTLPLPPSQPVARKGSLSSHENLGSITSRA
jgi:hypothetical protein